MSLGAGYRVATAPKRGTPSTLAAAATLIDHLNRTQGLGLRLIRPFDTGTEGALLVRRAGDEVLKAWPANAARERAVALATVCAERLRSAGWPIPRVLAWGVTSEVVYMLEERVGGAPLDRLREAHLPQIVRLIDSARNLGCDNEASPWIDHLRACVVQDHPLGGFRPSALARTLVGRKLIARALEALDYVGSVPASDVAHMDFGWNNMLARGREIAAILDWQRCRPGDSRFDLVGVGWRLRLDRADPYLIAWMEREIARRTPPELTRCYTAFFAVWSASWVAGTGLEHFVLAVADEVTRSFGLSGEVARGSRRMAP